MLASRCREIFASILTLGIVQDCIDELYSQVDKIQQYRRRGCVEIDGIPILPADNPKQLVKEVESLIGVNVSEEHVSVFIDFQNPRAQKIK